MKSAAYADLSGAGVRHLFSRCAICAEMIRGPLLRCIHCPSFELCLKCEPLAFTAPVSEQFIARQPHPADHVFQILYEPSEPTIEDLPRGSNVSVFGLQGAAAVLNDCRAQVWRYSSECRLYELKLPNGSRPLVPQQHVQPDVVDSAAAQEAVELAICQKEARSGFHLGV